jgi:predicted aminopeptidase
LSRRLAGAFAVALASLPLGGCTGARYLAQAAGGQLSLFASARPIRRAARDERLPARTRRFLREVPAIKRFGEANGLRATANYASYVHLDRPAVVWVVSACEPLRFKSKVWAFPVVGDFPYLGWFDRVEADGFAEGIRRGEALDVDVRGASAYSTLGWFQDPLLSTMISGGDEALGNLVNVVLHESVHATLHIPGQAMFNESLASFVGDRLTLSYLERTRGTASPERTGYEQAEAASATRAQRLHDAYRRLDELYRSERPDAEKLEEKGKILAALQEELKARRPLNNATLVQYKTYATGHPELEALLRACGGSYPRFMGALSRLNPGSFSRPHQEELGPVLAPLAEAGCR